MTRRIALVCIVSCTLFTACDGCDGCGESTTPSEANSARASGTTSFPVPDAGSPVDASASTLVDVSASDAASTDAAVPGAPRPPGTRCSDTSDSTHCSWSGLCTPGPGKLCLASEKTCAESEGCKTMGLCVPSPDRRRCVAVSNADCERSDGCKEFGRCRADENGYCHAACDVSVLETFAAAHKPTICVRSDDEPRCRDHRVCEAFQMCESAGDRCVAVDVECRTSEACREEGRCYKDYEGTDCTVFTSEDCRASVGCKTEGRCHAVSNECVTQDKARERCPDGVVEDGRCHHPLGYSCDEECKTENRCRPVTLEGRFVVCVETEEYCRSQIACRQKGICGVNVRSFHYRNKCYSQSGSKLACGSWTYGGCVKTEEGCQASVVCKKYGRCSSKSPSVFCRPTRTEHCQQSEICKKEGQCKLLDESSYYICGD